MILLFIVCLAIVLTFFSGCETSKASSKFAFAEDIPKPDVVPKVIYDPGPDYPKPLNAIDPWLEGDVEVIFVVETDGSVVEADGKAGDPRLREAAVNAVKQWKFEPATHEGKPARCVMSVTITFQKDDRPKNIPSGYIPRQVILPL